MFCTPAIETWLPVVGFEGLYEVSDHGNIRSLPRTTSKVRLGKMITARVPGRVMQPWANPEGYMCVEFSRGGLRKARLVHLVLLEAFEGPCPRGMEGRHGDGDPAHNHRHNLVYGTHSENMIDKIRHGTDHNACKTHCPAKHEYTLENTRVWHGRRSCRECGRRASRRWKQKQKAG